MTDTTRNRIETSPPVYGTRHSPTNVTALVVQSDSAVPALRPVEYVDVLPFPEIRSMALGLATETNLILGLMLIAAVAHGLNMFQYPSFTWLADEGTYVSEAWAIIRMGQLAHYTYMYGHVPGGWILLAALMAITGGPRALDMPVNTGRLCMFILHVAMVPLVYRLARKLGCGVPAAGLAAFLFSVSPLAVFYQRLFLLDNVMMFWTLVSLVLLLNAEGRLSGFALSGATFGVALLSKETDVFLFPVLLFMVWRWRRAYHGRFALVAWLVPMAIITSWYPLYAVLKGELLPAGFAMHLLGLNITFGNGPHVSLLDALAWQGSRGGGSLFDPNNDFWRSVRFDWLTKDDALLIGGIAATGLNLVRGLRRPTALAAGLLGLMPLIYLNHGGIVYQHYILFAIPFFCLNLAVLASPVFARLSGPNAAILALGIAAALLGRYWQTGTLQPLYTVEVSQTGRDAIVWIKQNLPADSMIITRDSFWPDLHEPGLGGGVFPNVHDHWQVATNPAVRDDIFHDDWHTVDYLLMMPDMPPMFRGSDNTIALDAYDNACRLKVWKLADGNDIELWKVDKTGASRNLLYTAKDPSCQAEGLTPNSGPAETQPNLIASMARSTELLLVATTAASDTARPRPIPKPTPKPSPGNDEAAVPATYTVRPGDSLSAIAYRFYGHASYWPAIAAANAKQVPNPNQLVVGQKLILPRQPGRSSGK